MTASTTDPGGRQDLSGPLGRRDLLEHACRLLDRIADPSSGESPPGDPSALLVVLEGSRGMGRTTLLDAVASYAARRAQPVDVLRAGGVPWEATRPLAVLRQLLPGTDLGADPAADLPAGADPFETAHRIIAALDARSAGATLVLLDDADTADPASLEALATAVRHHRDRRLLVLAARTAGSTGAAADVLDRVGERLLTLAPLDAGEVGDLASRAGITLHPSLADHLARHTGGRPAHVAELLASAPRETWRGIAPTLPAPPTVAADTRARLAAMGDHGRALVEAVAVLGPGTALGVAATVAASGDPLAAVDDAEASGLLHRRGGGTAAVLSLSDDMVAAAVRAGMGAAREASLHRLAAVTVDDEVRRLEHAAAAGVGPDPELADTVHALARVRASRGAWASAAELFLLAGRSSSDAALRGERLLLAVDALVGAGDVLAAASYLAEIESLPESAMRNAVLGYLAILRGRASEAESRLTRAWQLESGGRHPDVAATIAQRYVLHHLARCDGASLVSWADRAVELVGEDHPTAVEAQAIRGLGLGSTGRLGEALESYRSLWGHASGGAVGQRVQMGAGWLHLVADDVDLARAELTTAIPTDYLGGSTRISLWAHAWLARTHFVTGEWDQAMQVAAAALDLDDRAGLTLLVPLLRWTVTQIHALRGDWDTALDSARLGGVAGEYEIMRVPACLGRAAISEARADYAGVLTALAPLTRAGVSPDVAEPGFWPWPDVYANALVLEGRLDEAAGFLDHHEALARDRGHRSARARLGYARGRLLGARGDLPAARRTFEGSLELLEALPLVHDRARINFAYGQTLRRAGKRREADAVITAAREGYVALGATTYVRRCERELKAGGVHGVLRGRPAAALTPQEQAVAGLVAQGLRNKEVAAELFLSVKTVQFHLTRVYAKLAIRSRAELAALPREVLEGGS